MPDQLVPLEDDEQIEFVQWLELQGIKFTAIPNSTYTKSWKQKMRNKLLGLRPGLLDIFLVIRRDQSITGRGFALFIEMKRRKGGRLSEDQKAWIAAINGLDELAIAAYEAKGAEQAESIVSRHLKHVKPDAASPF